ncbi:MAG: DUF4785 domain-containing protein [Acidobacteriota bacterium]
MKKTLFAAFVATLLLLTPAFAQQVDLLPAGAGDLVPGNFTVVDRAAGAVIPDLPQGAAHYAWALDPAATLELAAPAVVVESREYFVDVSAAELSAGVPVYTTAPGALVRINPAPGRDGLAIDAASLTIEKDGLVQRGAIERLATDEQLRAAGAPFVDGTVAFRLSEGLGAGTFTVRAATGGDAPYVVHVLDKNSRHPLQLTTARGDILQGGTVSLSVDLPGVDLRRVDGFLASPAGDLTAIDFRDVTNGEIRKDITINQASTAPGLWEIHLVADGTVGGLGILRNARIPFQVAAPIARLGGTVDLARERGGLTATFGIDAQAAGRYLVTAVLFGTDAASGELRPVAMGHAANTFAGQGNVSLVFGEKLLAGTTAPYELRDLRLVDQARMGVMHQQQRGVVIP